MKHTTLLAVLCLLLAGCGDSPHDDTSLRLASEEHTKRIEAEQRAEKAEHNRCFWQSTAAAVGSTAVLLLVLGTALGSGARNYGTKKME